MIYGAIGDYFGRFENGKRNGEGVFKYKKNGNVYSGSWKYGVKMVMENLFLMIQK